MISAGWVLSSCQRELSSGLLSTRAGSGGCCWIGGAAFAELAGTDFQLRLSWGDSMSLRGSKTHTQSSGQGDTGLVCFLGTKLKTRSNNTSLDFDSCSLGVLLPLVHRWYLVLNSSRREGGGERKKSGILFFWPEEFRLCPLSTCFFSKVCSELGRAQYVFFNVLARSHEAMINPWMASLALKFERCIRTPKVSTGALRLSLH